jgi:hypothetical protein
VHSEGDLDGVDATTLESSPVDQLVGEGRGGG